jgi:hypothetical protein
VPKQSSPPQYLLHKGSGQAYATIDGKREYLGVHGSPESHARYGKLLAKWQSTNDVSTPEITVRQLALMFVAHADIYYRTPDGQPTGEADNFRAALKLPCAMFPGLPVSEFGAPAMTRTHGTPSSGSRSNTIRSGRSGLSIRAPNGSISSADTWTKPISPARSVM